MAGICYPNAEFTQLVTLTTEPTEKCKAYHGRMPMLIRPFEIDFWLQTEAVMLEARGRSKFSATPKISISQSMQTKFI